MDSDIDLAVVLGSLEGLGSTLRAAIGASIRQAIDEVIDGPRTGRWTLDALEKVEKTYIGTRVELVVRSAMGWAVGQTSDYLIAGVEVDAKFTLGRFGWMIPSEAIDQLCLLMAANDESHRFHVGLVRIRDEILTVGGNKDGKRSIKKAGRSAIHWVVPEGPLPTNFVAHEIDERVRRRVFGERTGQLRVNALFEQLVGTPIPRAAIVAVATEPEDPLARAVAARGALGALEILNGDDEEARLRARGLGIELAPRHFVSVHRATAHRQRGA